MERPLAPCRFKSETTTKENRTKRSRPTQEETEPPPMNLKGNCFSDLPLSDETLKALHEMGLHAMNQIQSRAIPPLLDGKDVMAVVPTSTGETLAFLIPAIAMPHEKNFTPRSATGVIVICPTGELAVKVHTDAKALLKYQTQTSALIMDGNGSRDEAGNLVNGVNLLIATPSRLLFHLKNTKGFLYNNLKCVIIHDADQGVNLKKQIKHIFRLLPKKSQHAFFCGTPSKLAEELAQYLFRKKKETENYVLLTLADENPKVNLGMVRQCYCIVPSNRRYLQINCLHIHNKMTQKKQTSTFADFCEADKGILLCTNDIIACASHVPALDWFLQYEPPENSKEYIYTLGQVMVTQEDKKTHLILFLRQEELKFLNFLEDAMITVEEYKCDGIKQLDLSSRLEKAVGENYYLNRLARDAYRSYICAYSSRLRKDEFNPQNINFQNVAASFCITCPPKVDLC